MYLYQHTKIKKNSHNNNNNANMLMLSKYVYHNDRAWWKVEGTPMLLQFILRGTWTSVLMFMITHLIAVKRQEEKARGSAAHMAKKIPSCWNGTAAYSLTTTGGKTGEWLGNSLTLNSSVIFVRGKKQPVLLISKPIDVSHWGGAGSYCSLGFL